MEKKTTINGKLFSIYAFNTYTEMIKVVGSFGVSTMNELKLKKLYIQITNIQCGNTSL